MKRIAIVQGHPDRSVPHLGDTLVEAYANAAREAGHTVEIVDVGRLDFPLLRSAEDFEHGSAPPNLAAVQHILAHSDHIVFVYPLWLGDMPALLKGFLEQVFRPSFVRANGKVDMPFGRGPLSGKSARLIVTMGMPALLYRLYFGKHSVTFRRNILGLVGIRKVHNTLIGNLGHVGAKRAACLARKCARLGRNAA